MTIDQEYEASFPLGELKHWEKNPNQGDIGAVAGSIQANGWYGAVIVQKSTNRIIAGNHRVEAARQSGLTHVPVLVVDVDDEAAQRINLADNRTTRLGSDDEQMLADILTTLAMTDLGLEGTGFDGDDLDALLEDLQAGDPEPPGPKDKRWRIVVDCGEDEAMAEKVGSVLLEAGFISKKEAK